MYALVGVALLSMGLYTLVVSPRLIRKIMALNVSGSGVFLFLVAVADQTSTPSPDPVPHAMVLTGIVVAVSATALALSLAYRIHRAADAASPGENDSV
jgi:multicomponent Na+:H+ antiporter subunit C